MRVFFLLLLLTGLHTSFLVSQENKPFSYKDDKELFERVVKVEEGLLHVQETLNLLLHQIDKRFAILQWAMGIGFTLVLGILITLLAKMLSLTPSDVRNKKTLSKRHKSREEDSTKEKAFS